MPPTTVAILATPESTASVVYGMYDLFMSAGRDWGLIVEGRPGPQVMRPLIVSSHADSFLAANDVRLTPQATLDAVGPVDIVCVPELLVAPDAPLDGRFLDEVDWLRRCHAAGVTLAATCSGTILLAETGLLDGCEATTHWAYCDVLRARHPRVLVRPQAALLSAGEGQRLVMTGGGTTWLDLALFLIARSAGIDVAMQTARVNLIDWHAVGQQPFARLARTKQVDDAVIGRCQEWIATHYRERSPVAAMVRLSGLPSRSFNRRFTHATGLSPLEYVHTLLLEEAKDLLERRHEPVEAIAEMVGYEDAAFFGRLFRRKVSLTPTQYRKRFGTMRHAITAGRIGSGRPGLPRHDDGRPGAEPGTARPRNGHR